MKLRSSIFMLLGAVLYMQSIKHSGLNGLLLLLSSYVVIPAAVLSICSDFYENALKSKIAEATESGQ